MDSNQKKDQNNEQVDRKESEEEGFMQRLYHHNVLSDALLVEVDQTEFTNLLIAEESIKDVDQT
ncbi:MAG: hypothetical protein AB2421_12665 [Thermotaleaceae bacterium]